MKLVRKHRWYIMAKDARGTKWKVAKLGTNPLGNLNKAYRVFDDYKNGFNFANELAKRDKTILYVMDYSSRILYTTDYREF